MTLWHNVLRIPRRCGECPWDDEIITDITYDTVDWWVHAEGLANHGIQNRKGLKFLICWQAKGAVRFREPFDLLLEKLLTDQAVSNSK